MLKSSIKLSFLLMIMIAFTANGEIIINELIQNPAAVGDSDGEWFELYNSGEEDVDINGWTIADNGADSHVITAEGGLIVPAGGYLVLGSNMDFATNGGVNVDYQYTGIFLGNSDDELILSDANGREFDRVEYDGGPGFPDPNGASMFLISPDLDNNVAANWAESTIAWEGGAGDFGSPGAENEDPPLPDPPVIVINEIMQNPNTVLDDAGEWFELYNPGVEDVDINGWTVTDNDGNIFVIENIDPLMISAGGYLVLGNNADFELNGGVVVDYQYVADFYLSNSADEIVLTDTNGTEIDRVEYDGGPGFPDPTGASMFLISPELDNNLAENWAESTVAWEGGAGDFGSPGAENEEPPEPITLVINEICQNPGAVGDNNGEWVELYNVSAVDIDIQGWTIADNDGETHLIDNLGPLVVPAEGYLVLGINSDLLLNGGVPVDYVYTGFNLSNSSDEVVLFDVLGVEVDRVEYDDGATFPDPTGASMALIDPELDNNIGANWELAMTAWPGSAGDLGTPGFTNVVELFFEIQNPGFELWTVNGPAGPPDGWMLADAAMMNATQQAEIFMGGQYSACVELPNEGASSLYQNVHGIQAGENYGFSGYVYENTDGFQAALNLAFYDATNTMIEDLSTNFTSDGLEFEPLSLELVAPEGVSYAKLSVLANGTGFGFVDNLVFEAIINLVETDIEQIQTNPEIMGAVVSFDGIITQGGNTCHVGYTDVYIQDETGYGVMLYSADPLDGAELMRGDLVNIVGLVDQYFDVTEVIDWTYELVSAGNPLPDPMVFSTGDFANNALAYEGSYAMLRGVLTNDPGAGSFNLNVDDGSGPCVVRINADAAIDFTDIVNGDEVTFFGTIDAYQAVPQLQPSGQMDVVPTVVTDIEQIQTNPDLVNALVNFTGIITQSGNTCHVGYTDVYIQDETGYGVMVYSADPLDGAELMRGDLVNITGTVLQYFDVTEVTDFTYELISTGNPLPLPMDFTTGDFALGALVYEGSYATVTGLLTTEPGEGSFNLEVDDGSGPCVVRINADAGLDFTGITLGTEVTFYGTIDAYREAPQLQPSVQEDIVVGGGQLEQMTLPLQENYFELISSYLQPEDMSSEAVFGGIENLSIVYQIDGGIYIPDVINDIDEINLQWGYKVFCSAASELTIQGELMDATLEYHFVPGQWHWLGYPVDFEVPVETALESIADQITIIINDSGEMWIPNLDMNTLGNMHPGEGYMLFINDEITFQYNIPAMRLVVQEDPDVWTIPDTEEAPIATGLPWPVLIDLDDNLDDKNPAMISIFDGDLKVGCGLVLEDHDLTPIIAWEGSEEYSVSGFVKGHEMTIKIYDAVGQEIAVVPGNDVPAFGEGAFASVSLTSAEGLVPTEFDITSIYPNPFNPTTSIVLAVPYTSDLQVEVFNILGERVSVLVDGQYTAGYHTVNFNAEQLASGVFFVKASMPGKAVQMRKILLVK